MLQNSGIYGMSQLIKNFTGCLPQRKGILFHAFWPHDWQAASGEIESICSSEIFVTLWWQNGVIIQKATIWTLTTMKTSDPIVSFCMIGTVIVNALKVFLKPVFWIKYHSLCFSWNKGMNVERHVMDVSLQTWRLAILTEIFMVLLSASRQISE
jgi:hypothetical protein